MQQVLTEQNENNYRPGFAKRKLQLNATSQKLPSKLAAYEVQQAIALGLPELSSQERDLLQFYTAFLNLTGLKERKTSVWPSNRLTCKLLGMSEATLRRYKATLEHKGYILRCYDRRNRPLEQGAIELAPLLNQVKSLIANIESEFKAQQAHYQSLRHQTKDKIGVLELSAYPLISEPHKHIKTNIEVFVPKDGVVKGGQESDLKGIGTRQNPSLDMQSAKVVVEISHTLAPYFTGLDWDDLSASKVWELLDQCVNEMFLNGTKCIQAWERAKNRFGIQAIELLVVSMEDPKIKDCAKFLGFMAFKWSGELNLKPNLKRILELRKKDLEEWDLKGIAHQIRQKSPIFKNTSILDHALHSWFANAIIEKTQDQITIWVKNEFIRSRIGTEYLPILQRENTETVKICILG